MSDFPAESKGQQLGGGLSACIALVVVGSVLALSRVGVALPQLDFVRAPQNLFGVVAVLTVSAVVACFGLLIARDALKERAIVDVREVLAALFQGLLGIALLLTIVWFVANGVASVIATLLH